uniref:RRM domain-containing protein n=1 Tax=Salvator merianae TaxID=96440 RepID=A0A8D0DXL6_SALMN
MVPGRSSQFPGSLHKMAAFGIPNPAAGSGQKIPAQFDWINNPPNSCLFVKMDKNADLEEIQNRFSPFGKIQTIRVMRDTRTKAFKSCFFVKYTRSFHACLAMEAMNLQSSSQGGTQIQVCMADNRTSGTKTNCGDQQLTQIRICIPKSLTEENLIAAFKAYGKIESCFIARSKVFKHNTGVAYIKFSKASEAALAIEECHKDYQASLSDVLVDSSESLTDLLHVNVPMEQTQNNEIQGSSLTTLGSRPSHEVSNSNLLICGEDKDYRISSAEPVTKSSQFHGDEYYKNSANEIRTHQACESGRPTSGYRNEYYATREGEQETGHDEMRYSSMSSSRESPELANLERSSTRSREPISRCLSVVSQFPLVQEQLFNLFDLIPGLESCETHRKLYSKHAYAVVKYDNVASAVYAKRKLHGFEFPFGNFLAVSFIEDEPDESNSEGVNATTSQLSPRTSDDKPALQHLGLSTSGPSPQLQRDGELSSKRMKVPSDSVTQERLFIVFKPHPLPEDKLVEILSKFGNFTNFYLIAEENVGYAMFSDRTSANSAIAALDGKTVNGVRLKVILANLPTEKRQRTF